MGGSPVCHALLFVVPVCVSISTGIDPENGGDNTSGESVALLIQKNKEQKIYKLKRGVKNYQSKRAKT